MSRQGTCLRLQTSLGHASAPKVLLNIHGNQQIVSGKVVIKHRKLSSEPCDDLGGGEEGAGEEVRERGHVYTYS